MIQKISKASEQIAGGTDDARLRASFLEKEVYVNSYLNVLRTASAIALCQEFWLQPEWRSGLSLPEWTKEHAVSSKEGHSSTFCCSLARLQLGTSPGSHFNVLSLTPTLCFLPIVTVICGKLLSLLPTLWSVNLLLIHLQHHFFVTSWDEGEAIGVYAVHTACLCSVRYRTVRELRSGKELELETYRDLDRQTETGTFSHW